MAVPLLSKKIVKKRVKKFKRPQSDRKISVKVYSKLSIFIQFFILFFFSAFYFELWFLGRRENDDSYCRPSLTLHILNVFICKVGDWHFYLIPFLNFIIICNFICIQNCLKICFFLWVELNLSECGYDEDRSWHPVWVAICRVSSDRLSDPFFIRGLLNYSLISLFSFSDYF